MAASSALGRHAARPVEKRAGLFVFHESCSASEHLLDVVLGSGLRRHIEILGEVQRRGCHRGGKHKVSVKLRLEHTLR